MFISTCLTLMSMKYSRVSLVVGGTSGIGAEVSRLMAAEGRRVVISGSRSADDADDLVRNIPGAAYLQADMQNPDAPAQLVGTVADRYGRLDEVVYSAGATVK